MLKLKHFCYSQCIFTMNKHRNIFKKYASPVFYMEKALILIYWSYEEITALLWLNSQWVCESRRDDDENKARVTAGELGLIRVACYYALLTDPVVVVVVAVRNCSLMGPSLLSPSHWLIFIPLLHFVCVTRENKLSRVQSPTKAPAPSILHTHTHTCAKRRRDSLRCIKRHKQRGHIPDSKPIFSCP